MSVFTYHLLKISLYQALKNMIFPLKSKNIEGLIHAETMSAMILGSPVFSSSRFLSREIIVFAQWENDQVFDNFLASNSFGIQLTRGWYVKLEFIRQWGEISGFQIPNETQENHSDENPVIAVTIAKMKFTEIPRFIRWGRPVEKLVRDHPSTTLSLASIKYPNMISTFSIWKTQKEMTDMVRGHSAVPKPKRHIDAMKEHDRKNFHFEFITLRFKPISEFGQWKGKTNLTHKNQNLE
ncbi:hypothetical protein ABDJ41_21570 [Pedobacter sp. ASV1-7]|uniref:hypothetical protein n=1 Tax=Pedobacter sp. ASV1-7 TaxID=3145237 RepID=UPI0032E8B39A